MIPEILPYEYSEEEKKALSKDNSSINSNGFLEGIWGGMNSYERDNLQHFDNIVRIDNREIITEVVK